MPLILPFDLLPTVALLGNDIRPTHRHRHCPPDQRINRRVLSSVNRSLASLRGRLDRKDPARPVAAAHLAL